MDRSPGQAAYNFAKMGFAHNTWQTDHTYVSRFQNTVPERLAHFLRIQAVELHFQEFLKLVQWSVLMIAHLASEKSRRAGIEPAQ